MKTKERSAGEKIYRLLSLVVLLALVCLGAAFIAYNFDVVIMFGKAFGLYQ